LRKKNIKKQKKKLKKNTYLNTAFLNYLTTSAKCMLMAIGLLLSSYSFSQEKKQGTTDANAVKTTSVVAEPYRAARGRVIEAAIADQYVKVLPEYSKKLTFSKSKNTYLDNNELELMIVVSQKYGIDDANLKALMEVPENKKQVDEILDKMNPNKRKGSVPASVE